jgi:uncharacterized protein (TIGR00297 family)
MAMDEMLVVAAVCAILCALVYYKRVLTLGGAAAAMAFGLVIGYGGGLSWIVLLLVFLVTSFAATRYRFELKRQKCLQEGTRGERGWTNVVANGLPALAVAVLVSEPVALLETESGAVLFLCAISVAASDTIASELGVFARKTWLITSFRRVRAGVNGGVSLPGTAAAAMAAAYTGLVGAYLFDLMDGLHLGWHSVILVAAIGFLGCQIDSVIGATLENRGKVSKLTNNLFSISLGTAIAWMVLEWLL